MFTKPASWPYGKTDHYTDSHFSCESIKVNRTEIALFLFFCSINISLHIISNLLLKSDHIQPILQSLHWLPVTHRIQYKISTSSFTSTRKLHSASDTPTFVIPRVNTMLFGERPFSYTGLSVWHNLPRSVHHSDSSSSFKTHLFQNCF